MRTNYLLYVATKACNLNSSNELARDEVSGSINAVGCKLPDHDKNMLCKPSRAQGNWAIMS